MVLLVSNLSNSNLTFCINRLQKRKTLKKSCKMVMIANFQPPASPVRLQEENVTVLLDKKNLGIGTLYISERKVFFNFRIKG